MRQTCTFVLGVGRALSSAIAWAAAVPTAMDRTIAATTETESDINFSTVARHSTRSSIVGFQKVGTCPSPILRPRRTRVLVFVGAASNERETGRLAGFSALVVWAVGRGLIGVSRQLKRSADARRSTRSRIAAGVELELRGSADVAVMQATDIRNGHDLAESRRLNGAAVGCILVERKVSAGAVVVREVGGQNAPPMAVAEHDDMVEAVAAHGADEPLRERILPRPLRRREDFVDAHALDATAEVLTVDVVTIAQEIRRC
jgi:hypothetical protein